MKKINQIEKVLKVLNEAFKADPDTIHALMVNRIPCNFKLANHPTVQVEPNRVLKSGQCHVGALGLINGIIEPLTGERVAMVFTDGANPEFKGFVKYQKA